MKRACSTPGNSQRRLYGAGITELKLLPNLAFVHDYMPNISHVFNTVSEMRLHVQCTGSWVLCCQAIYFFVALLPLTLYIHKKCSSSVIERSSFVEEKQEKRSGVSFTFLDFNELFCVLLWLFHSALDLARDLSSFAYNEG